MWDIQDWRCIVCAIVLCMFTDTVQGRVVYLSKTQHWITQEIMTWDESKQNGDKQGTIMATPIDVHLIDYIKPFLDVNNNFTFISNFTNVRNDPKPQFVSVEDIPYEWNNKDMTKDSTDMKPATTDNQETLDTELTDTIEATLDTKITDDTTEDSLDTKIMTNTTQNIWDTEPTDTTEKSLYTMTDTTEETYSDTTEETAMTMTDTTEWKFSNTIEETSATITTEGTTQETLDTELKKDMIEEVIVTETPAEKCESEGYEFSSTGGCYKVHDEYSYWRTASETCSQEGGYLVILNDEMETNAVLEIVEKKLGETVTDSSLWTGLKKNRYGEWRSIHGDYLKDLFNVWRSGDDTRFRLESCAYLALFGKLGTFDCDVLFHFICEKDI